MGDWDWGLTTMGDSDTDTDSDWQLRCCRPLGSVRIEVEGQKKPGPKTGLKEQVFNLEGSVIPLRMLLRLFSWRRGPSSRRDG